MRLSEIEFRDWCRKNQVSKEAKLLIERIRSSEPSRRVRSGSQSVIGTFPSRKMGVTIQFESHKCELPFIHELEHDPEVIEYYDQPLPIKLNYIGKNNRNLGVMHTPDFLVIKKNWAGFVECKTEDGLLDLAVRQPNRYKLDENDTWICPPGEIAAAGFDLSYRVRSTREINWTYQRNVEFLDDYYREEKLSYDGEKYLKILEIVKSEPAITLEQLFEKVSKLEFVSRDDIYSLIAFDKIYVDLKSQLLTEPENVRLFSSREISDTYINASVSAAQAKKNFKPATVNLVPNTGILWDGRGWKILNVGEKEVTLTSENEEISVIQIKVFEKLVQSEKIQGLPESKDDSSTDPYKIIFHADENALAIANQRLPYVLGYLNDGEIPDDLPVSEKTLQRWVKSYRESEQIYGQGYPGLIPHARRGNENSRIDEENRKLLQRYVVDVYETAEQRKCLTVYRAYKAECEKKSIVYASYVTFCDLIKKRPEYEQTLKRQGKRAAYKHEEFYWQLEQDTPRHGERPFHIAHIDHTELDVQLIDAATGKKIGRCWLSLMIDAFSRKILAVYLTFNSPSKISCMMLLRECVRRHGRLPQILVVDGGKEFASIYFESLLAHYEVTKKTRPPAKSRFGSVIERLFGTVNTQFIHNLIGNTQITRNVRQVTKSNNPKNKAVWTLPELFDRLCEWAYEVYDQTEHSTLNETPREAFTRGMLVSGERKHKLIPYNEEFKLMTLPSTAKGTAKVILKRGVKINRILYWSKEFDFYNVTGEQVEVRYDPFDMGIAYAYIGGKWRECYSQHWKAFKNRSEKEIYLATEVLRKRQKGANITAPMLAAFLTSVEAQEILLKQRMLDRQHQPILAQINGIAAPESSFRHVDVAESNKQGQVSEKVEDNVISFPSVTEKVIKDTGRKFGGYPIL
ncbi:MAG: DDE-type integrase/transposase/recombinase [Pyrinomonadaceae bacterium]